MFAESTKQTYRTHPRSFHCFCIMYGFPAVPAWISTITCYAAYPTHSQCYSSVNQYLNIVRIIHLEFGLPNSTQDNWTIQSVLKGIKRGKGTNSARKYPVMPSHILLMLRNLNLSTRNDKLIWTYSSVASLWQVPQHLWCSSVFIPEPAVCLDLFNPRKIAVPSEIFMWGIPWSRKLFNP